MAAERLQKMNYTAKNYWEKEQFTAPYHMGEQIHRLYILNKFKEIGVNSLLDVGCGTGPILDLLINLDEEGRWDNITKYKGVDYSRTMIQTAKESMPYGEFAFGDARKLDEKSNSYDCVLLMHTLDHLDDYQAAIAEAVRVSKKYICIVLWRSIRVEPGTNISSNGTMERTPEEGPWEDTHLQEYSKEALIEEFDKYHLEDVDFNNGTEVNEGNTDNTVWILKKP